MAQFSTAAVTPQIRPPAGLPAASGSRGFVVQNAFAGATAIPTIDARGFVAAAASVGDIGQGLQDVGGQVNKLALIRLEASNQLKVLEGESMMEMEAEGIGKEMANHQDVNNWTGLAAKRADEFRAKLFTKDLSPDARDALTARFTVWRSGVIHQAEKSATTRVIQQLGQQYNARVMAEADKENWPGSYQAVEDAVTALVMTRPAADAKIAELRQQQKTSQLATLERQLTQAHLNGDPSQVTRIMDEAHKTPGLQPEELAASDQRARTLATDQKAELANKQQTKFYGELIYSIAKGDVIVPAQIDGLVKEGRLDPIAGARLREEASLRTGAMPGEFQDFIVQEVLTYNEQKDKDFSQRQNIMRKAFSLGMSSDQADRFRTAFDSALQRNRNEKGRTESGIMQQGLSQIYQLFKDGALQGPLKPGPAPGENATGTAPQPPWAPAPSPGSPSGIAPATSQTDRAAQQRAAALAEQMADQFMVGYQGFMADKQRLPSPDETRVIISGITRPWLDQSMWSPFLPRPPAHTQPLGHTGAGDSPSNAA